MTSDRPGATALAFALGALTLALVGVGVYRAFPDQGWTLWTGFAVSALLAGIGLVRALRVVRRRESDRGLPIAALVLSAAILTVELGLTLIVLALTYAFRDFTF